MRIGVRWSTWQHRDPNLDVTFNPKKQSDQNYYEHGTPFRFDFGQESHSNQLHCVAKHLV